MKPKKNKISLKLLLGFLAQSKYMMILAVFIALLGVLPTILAPRITEEITNRLITLGQNFGVPAGFDESYHRFIEFGVIAVMIFIAGFVLSTLASLVMNEVTQKITQGLRRDINIKINRVPIAYFDKQSVGDVLSRATNDIDNLAQNLSQTITEVITSIVTIVGLAVMMFVSSWQLALVVVLSVPLGMVLLGVIMSFSQKHFVKQQQLLGTINGHIEETYSAQEVIKIFNASSYVKETFNQENAALRKVSFMSNLFTGLMQPLMMFMYNLSYIAVLVVAGILVASNQIGAGVLISFLIYVRLFSNPIINMAQYGANIQMMSAAAERINALLSAEELGDESDKDKHIEEVKGMVEFRHVKFGYVPETQVIKDFSTIVKPGSKVAIVGPTGAGKTTLVNLLMRFYDFEGEILIDNIDTKDMKREDVAKLFSMVLQDTWLFEGTIEENLRYNAKDMSLDDIIKAAKMANVHHYIDSLPDGYQTILSEKSSVSGGQRQLLTIARAMIQQAPMLILDEATSNVDTRTELLIQEAMDALMKNRTSFVIAHRLSTIKNADIILVLKDGDILEQGTHQELIEKKGFYKELYESQFDHAS